MSDNGSASSSSSSSSSSSTAPPESQLDPSLLAQLDPESGRYTSPKATEMHYTLLAGQQDRNTSNTVFGGQILRLGNEHARTVAARHAGGTVDFVCMEDVSFL